jgi:GNAT superfamily N-acetyltransferase
MSIVVRPIRPEETHVMRQGILRRHQALAEMEYPGDRDAATVHFGAFEEQRLLGIASLYREPWKDDPQPGDWRLRGMAVDEQKRGSGLGAKLLTACGRHMAERGGKRLWCYARAPACGFYEKFGLSKRGPIWDEAGIGPHVVMAGDVHVLLARGGGDA